MKFHRSYVVFGTFIDIEVVLYRGSVEFELELFGQSFSFSSEEKRRVLYKCSYCKEIVRFYSSFIYQIDFILD